MLREDTRELLRRDMAEERARWRTAKRLLGEVLEGLSDSECKFILKGALYYGWPMANGEWHPSVHNA